MQDPIRAHPVTAEAIERAIRRGRFERARALRAMLRHAAGGLARLARTARRGLVLRRVRAQGS